MKNVLFLILIVASLVLAIFFFRQYTIAQSELALANRRLTDRDTQIYRLQKLITPSKSLPMAPTESVTSSPSTLGKLSPAEIGRLQQKGLAHPEADLKENLLTNQKNLLTTKGVLGGTHQFRDIQILNEHYALVYFENGQQGGYMLLRYNATTSDQISWQVLDAYTL